MQIKEYCEKSKNTCADLHYREKNNLHMILGMLTEVGELADVYKKKLAYDKEIDIINVKEEIGDLMFYISNFCRMNNFDLEEILEKNIEKLKTRYPEKFDSYYAINRDLNKERDILES